MELLATNQPWNLLIFMAIPVILAEVIAISELYLLFTRKEHGRVYLVSKWAGILAGVYFLGVFVYLFLTAVVPITTHNEWRSIVDLSAVLFYLLGVVPLVGIALLELGITHKKENKEEKRKAHAIYVGFFLVVAHIAMILGMLNPYVFTRASERGLDRVGRSVPPMHDVGNGTWQRDGEEMPMHEMR
jgi:L-cystine uptake protein TcyP (sodium:dicarboxylate symporter family)